MDERVLESRKSVLESRPIFLDRRETCWNRTNPAHPHSTIDLAWLKSSLDRRKISDRRKIAKKIQIAAKRIQIEANIAGRGRTPRTRTALSTPPCLDRLQIDANFQMDKKSRQKPKVFQIAAKRLEIEAEVTGRGQTPRTRTSLWIPPVLNRLEIDTQIQRDSNLSKRKNICTQVLQIDAKKYLRQRQRLLKQDEPRALAQHYRPRLIWIEVRQTPKIDRRKSFRKPQKCFRNPPTDLRQLQHVLEQDKPRAPAQHDRPRLV